MQDPAARTGDPPPDEKSVAERLERRRALYESLVGGAVGGRYQLVRLIDFGSMGAVYAARHKRDEHPRHAVKILDPDLAAQDRRYVQRFLREARILEGVDHPNVVKVFEHGLYQPPGADDGLHYYVMELVEGADGNPVTLHQYARQHDLRMEQVVYFVSQILSGLRHVHEHGVVHRDLKPWNVLVGRDGECKIVDFGLAKIPDSTLTDIDELFGTRDYIAPELFYRGAREATATSDLFAVGRIFADLVERVDFTRSRAGVFASKAAALKYLDALLERLVQEDPRLRFADADEVLQVLRDFQETTRIRPTVGAASRLVKEGQLASASRRRWIVAWGRWLFDYGLFVAGVLLLPLVWGESRLVAAVVAGSLVTSKLWSALSHPPDRHPVGIVVRALAARLNRIVRDGDFRVVYLAPRDLRFARRRVFRARHFSGEHRRHERALQFPEGHGLVGLAARMRATVLCHSVPRFGSEDFRTLFEKHLDLPESKWGLLDPTRRSYLCTPLFRIRRGRGGPALEVVGVLSVSSRVADAVLRSEVGRAVREYAAVIQDVIEPVHGSHVREIIAGGAAPLETILVNGLQPRIPPVETRATVEAPPAPPRAG